MAKAVEAVVPILGSGVFPVSQTRGVGDIELSLLAREQDTICAIATPVGPGGIGIVRISGSKAKDILKAIFRPKAPVEDLCTHRMYYGHIIDPANNSECIDECMAVFMEAPKSYTREDVAEIQSHSGYAVLKRVLDIVVAQGARLASPGEFTKRAFLNGRIDLAQAEALMELIGAQTETERRLAVKGLLGQGTPQLECIREALLNALAHIEVAIDFPEEDIEIVDPVSFLKGLKTKALDEIERLIQQYHEGRIFREGARVVFAGRPNVGKSSIFNAILGMGRVIVSPVPGTTRDTIEESVEIQGIRIVLVDTAGIRGNGTQGGSNVDEIEAQGIELSIAEVNRASLVLIVLDISQGMQPEDHKLFHLIPRDIPYIVIFNKADRLKDPEGELAKLLEDLAAKAPRFHNSPKTILISARTGLGLDELKKAIFHAIVDKDALESIAKQGFMPNLRQKECLERARDSVKNAMEGVERSRPLEIIAMDLRDAMRAVDEITGRGLEGDLLDAIFSRFCLGK